jgi:hypothetical protein
LTLLIQRAGLYNITNSHGKVAQFCLFKQAYRVGDDVVGTCDFADSSVPCVQVGIFAMDGKQLERLRYRRLLRPGFTSSWNSLLIMVMQIDSCFVFPLVSGYVGLMFNWFEPKADSLSVTVVFLLL